MDIKCQHCGSYNNIREVVEKCLECNQNLFKPKTENMNPFKVNDTVYHIKYGEGLVIEVQTDTVLVKYEKESHWHSDLMLLSFTPYKLEGFTQERPFEPEIGKFYWFCADDMLEQKTVIYGKLGGIYPKEKYPYYCMGAASYSHISDKNPLENDSE